MKGSPGSSLRQIQRASGLPFGTVSYHLSYLLKHGLIKKQADGNSHRFFTLDQVIKDENLLILLRQNSVRRIILFIFMRDCNHNELVKASNLSASTVTWHLKKIIDAGVVKEKRQGKFKVYSLAIPKERIMDILIVYKESFLDKLVNGLIEMWDR